MKKAIFLLSMISGLVLISCGKKAEKETVIEKETVVAPGETETTPTETKNPDGTSVAVGKNGISVSTKSGTNNTSVSLSKDSSKVVIKK